MSSAACPAAYLNHGGNRHPAMASAAACCPQVALLFLVHGDIPTEPIWRAFLEMAARLSLKQPVSVQHPPTNSNPAAAAVHGRSMHPALQELPDARYPWFRVQHGLAPGYKALPPSRSTRIARQLSGCGWGPGAVASMLYGWLKLSWESWLGGGASGAYTGTYVGAYGWEQEAIAAEHARLMSDTVDGSSQRSRKSRSTDDSDNHSTQQQQQQPQWRLPSQPTATVSTTGGRVSAHGPSAERHSFASQDLFSVYVHARPGFHFPAGSIFAGHEVAHPVNTTNGYAQHALVRVNTDVVNWCL